MEKQPIKSMPLLKISDLVRELNLHRNTVEKYIKEGQIKCIRIGGRIRISPEELDRIRNEGI